MTDLVYVTADNTAFVSTQEEANKLMMDFGAENVQVCDKSPIMIPLYVGHNSNLILSHRTIANGIIPRIKVMQDGVMIVKYVNPIHNVELSDTPKRYKICNDGLEIPMMNQYDHNLNPMSGITIYATWVGDGLTYSVDSEADLMKMQMMQ